MDFDSSVCEDDITQKLKDEIEQLKHENSFYKSQFEDAVSISKEMENMRSQNSKANSDLRDAISDKEDALKRLEISLQTINELKQQIKDENQYQSHQMSENNDLHKKEIEELNNKSKDEISKMEKQIKFEKDEKERLANEQKVLKNKMDSLIQCAIKYFNTNMDSIDDVIGCFEQQNNNSIISNSSKETSQSFNNDDSLKLLRKLKLKVKKLKEDNHKLVANIEKCKDDNKQLKKSVFQITESKNKAINTLTQEKEDMELDYKKTIKGLRAKILSLNEEIKNAKSIKETKEIDPLPNVVIQQVSPVKQNNVDSHLYGKIKELKTQISFEKSQKDKAISEFKEIQDKNESLISEIESQKNKIESLKILYQESLTQIESLRQALLLKQQETIKSQKEDEKGNNIKEDRKKLNQLEFLNQKYANQIKEFQENLKYTQDLLKQQKNENEELKSKIEDLNNDLKKSDLKLFNYQVKETNKNEDEQIPLDLLVFKGEPELEQKTLKIAQNTILHVTSRLQQIYKTVLLYFQNELNQKENLLNKKSEEMNEILEKINNFISKINEILNICDVSSHVIFDENSQEELISQIEKVRNDLTNQNNENIIIRGIIYNINKYLNLDNNNGSIQEMVKTIEQSVQNIINISETQNKKIKKLKSYIKSKMNKEQIKEANLNDQNKELQSSVDTLNNEKENQKYEIINLKKYNKKLKDQIANLETENSGLLQKQKLQNKEMNELKEQSSNNETHLKKQIQILHTEYQNLQNEYEKCNSILVQTRKIFASQKSINKKQQAECQQLLKEKEELESTCSSRIENQKLQLSKAYQNTISEFQKLSESNCNDIQNLTKQLTSSKQAENELSEKITQLNNQKANLEKRNQMLKESIDREKSLLDNLMKAKINSIESEYKVKLETLKNDNDKKISNIYSYVIDSFHNYYHPGEQINEKSFKQIIYDVKNHISDLSNSNQTIRRLLQVDEKQTTQDAIAQLLFDIKKNKTM